MSSVEILAAAAVAVGALVQAVTGIGFALVCGPLLVLCLGPHQGVIVTSALGLALSLLVLVREWKSADPWQALRLFVPACLVLPFGVLILHRVSPAVLSVLIGVLILLAVAVLASGFRWKGLRGARGAVFSGAASGMMGLLAGVGGPAVAMYAVNAEWDVKKLRATINAYFTGMSIVYLFVRGVPSTSLQFGAGLAAAVGVGFGAGTLFARRTNPNSVRKAILVLATFGGLAAIVKGMS